MFSRGCGFSLEYWLFGSGWCLLENLCTRFYTKLVRCYETEPMSLVNWRHFVHGRSSARSSCCLFPNTGNLSEKWKGGGCAPHLWSCTSSAVEASEVAASTPSCLCCQFPIFAPVSSLDDTEAPFMSLLNHPCGSVGLHPPSSFR